jgi:hypothetical protein
MNSGKIRLGACLIAAALLVGCGSPGVPQPPSLELARPVRDLKAFRKGNEVHLTWSVPTETTDHQIFRHAGNTQICRGIGGALKACGTPIAEMHTPTLSDSQNTARYRRSSSPRPANPQADYTDRLSTTLEMNAPTSNLVYGVSILNSYSRSAGLSNQVQVPSAPTLAAPANFNAKLTPEGVAVTWSRVPAPPEVSGLRYAYRIYRREAQSGHDAIAGEVSFAGNTEPALLDSNFEWEKAYDYRATTVTFVEQGNASEQVEGEDTPSVRIVAHDIFAPAMPTGLQAVFSGPGQKPFIDLIWNANSEPDLAGYNVYRHEPNGELIKINTELVKVPAFRDPNVLAGHEYFYSVTSVDTRGNESEKSEKAYETVPAT